MAKKPIEELPSSSRTENGTLIESTDVLLDTIIPVPKIPESLSKSKKSLKNITCFDYSDIKLLGKQNLKTPNNKA